MIEYVWSMVPGVPMWAVFADVVDEQGLLLSVENVKSRPVLSLDHYVEVDNETLDEGPERLCAVMVLDDAGRMTSAVNIDGFVGLTHMDFYDPHVTVDDRVSVVTSMIVAGRKKRAPVSELDVCRPGNVVEFRGPVA